MTQTSTARTALLTLGRLPKALDIARALHAAGWRVIVAEPSPRHLTGASRSVARSVRVCSPIENPARYLEELMTVIRSEGVELVVPVSEEILFASALRERVPAGVRVHALAQTRLLALHDKFEFTRRCAAAGVRVPETWPLDHPQAITLAATGPVVVKPVFSCSGRGVLVLPQGAALPARSERSIVQRFCLGTLLSTFSIARRGEVRLTVTYRGAVMQGSVAVCFERIDTPPAVSRWVERFVAHEQFDGFISFDLIESADGQISGIECNPRATSGLHFVEPADLARAIVDPQDDTPLRYRSERLQQQFYPCLTETQKSVFGGPFRHNLRCLWRARDVTWSARDPWPLISMPWTAWPIIAQSIRRGCTFGEVAMEDLSWSDEAGSVVAGGRNAGVE